MASLDQVPRDGKRRIASAIHDNLVTRATTGPADSLLDPFINKSAAIRVALADLVEDKVTAIADRPALLVETDVSDDDVDRWYRHGYRYLEVETLRRHAPEHAAIDALFKAAYPHGLAHIDDRIPDQNEEVRQALAAFQNPEHAAALAATSFPITWINALDTAVKKSDASFVAYQATFGQASTAVALGRDAENDWVLWARALSHAVALRSTGADIDIVEENKRLIEPLTNAVRLLRTQARTRETKRKNEPTP